MARDLRRRIAKLAAARPRAEEGYDPQTLRLMTDLARCELLECPDLALVEECDADPETWRDISFCRVLLAGDREQIEAMTRERLREPLDEPEDGIEALNDLARRAMESGRKRRAALEAARRRIAQGRQVSKRRRRS